MNTASLLRLAPIAVLLMSSVAQARTHVAPHVFETRLGGVCATTPTPAEPGATSSRCDTPSAAEPVRLRESPTRISSGGKKEFKGHVTLLK